MKKRFKKLNLSKETVRKLEDGMLVKAAGGDTISYCAPGCGTYPSCRICWEQPISEGC